MLSRKRKKDLRLGELIAIALGGMVGGGIFSILGISVEQIGNATPIAIALGGILAFFAAYSYVKLAILYKDEGATYSFFKKTFPQSHFAASIIGWLIVFGYISTLALYAFTFSSYFCSQFTVNIPYLRTIVAGAIIAIFAIINIVSVKGMGRIEDWMVYTKIILLLFISGLLAGKGDFNQIVPIIEPNTTLSSILIISSITFVSYEGFQLVIHAYKEMESPQKNIPRAIYSSLIIACLIYIVLAISALSALPKEQIIQDKEYALAAGAKTYLGNVGYLIVLFGALLATSSAISGTLFGASRLMAVIADDGYFPSILSKRIKTYIPVNAIIIMCVCSFILIITGSLQVILEFGSITFILVSFLMALSNFKVKKLTHSHNVLTFIAMFGLLIAAIFIFYYEFIENPLQLTYILSLYIIIGFCAYFYSKKHK